MHKEMRVPRRRLQESRAAGGRGSQGTAGVGLLTLPGGRICPDCPSPCCSRITTHTSSCLRTFGTHLQGALLFNGASSKTLPTSLRCAGRGQPGRKAGSGKRRCPTGERGKRGRGKGQPRRGTAAPRRYPCERRTEGRRAGVCQSAACTELIAMQRSTTMAATMTATMWSTQAQTIAPRASSSA